MLSLSKLQTNLQTWLEGKQTYATVQDSCDAFASQYEDYCKDAMDFSGDTYLAGLNQSGCSSTLAPFLNVPGVSATAAAGFAAAISVMWTGVTFNISIPDPGHLFETSSTVTVPPLAAVITPGLTAVFSVPGNSDSIKAQQMAAVIHPATLSTIVTIIGPSAFFPFFPVAIIGTIL